MLIRKLSVNSRQMTGRPAATARELHRLVLQQFGIAVCVAAQSLALVASHAQQAAATEPVREEFVNVAISPVGRFVMRKCSAGIAVFDAESGKLAWHRAEKREGRLHAVSSDLRRILISNSSPRWSIWHIGADQHLWSIEDERDVACFECDQELSCLGIAHENGAVEVHDLLRRTVLARRSVSPPVECMGFSRDCSCLVVATTTNERAAIAIHFWNWRDGSVTLRGIPRNASVQSAAVDEQGRCVAMAFDDNSVLVCRRDASQVTTIATDSCLELQQLSKDGRWILAQEPGRFAVFDTSNGDRIDTFSEPHPRPFADGEAPLAAVFGKDTTKVYAAWRWGDVQHRDFKRGRTAKVLTGIRYSHIPARPTFADYLQAVGKGIL